MISSDYQESKNVDTSGPSIMPNTRTASATLHVVSGIAVNWLLPVSGRCVPRHTRLEVAAGGPAHLRSVQFFADIRRVAVDRSGDQGLWSAAATLKPGRHLLVATAVDAKGRTGSARHMVRVCSA
jgi:hypothetical protein